MVLEGTPEFTVIPPLPVIVSVWPSAFNPSPLTESAIVRLLIDISAPRTVAVGAVRTEVPETMTSAPEPGTSPWAALLAVALQLLVSPLDAAQTLVAPASPPVQ